jgi:hypothetical protein
MVGRDSVWYARLPAMLPDEAGRLVSMCSTQKRGKGPVVPAIATQKPTVDLLT